MALHCIIALEVLRMYLREALGHLVPVENLQGIAPFTMSA